jgi:hypothetical protein
MVSYREGVMKCGYHPEREAVGTCVGCGRGICEFCKTIINAEMHCPDCIEKIHTSPNIMTPEIKGTSASSPAYSHTTNRAHWRWVFPILLLSVGIIFIIHAALSSGNQGSNGWVGPDGETEYEYISCGANCYYVGGDGHLIELVNNPDAKNPTWEELKNFLVVDHTDNQSYVDGSFVCADSAEMLHNNAEKAGIRAAYVHIVLSDGVLHANNAFNTTDEGLVYIDDTGIGDTALIRNSGCCRDKRVAVSIGSEYIAESIFSCPWSSDWESMGIVTNVSIQW